MTREEIEKLPVIIAMMLISESVTAHTKEKLHEKLTEVCNLAIKALAQEPQPFKWCTDCKEYDTEKHCCHRYSKVIRDIVAEIRQEPILDKIKSEIEAKCCITVGRENDGAITLHDVFEIIDKYKAESEG